MKNKYEVNYDYLRKKKPYHLREWYDESFECKSNLKATSYLNAVILPLKSFSGDSLLFGRGGVIDENKKYIESSGIDDRVQYAYNFEECETINKKVVYCGYLINHWGHFLVEAVSRLWYFLENDNTIDKYIFFVSSGENRELKGNFKEFLQLLGVYEKIEIINKPTRYKEVIIPELGYKRRTYFSEQQKKVFDKIFENVELKPEWVPYQKIYFSRSKLKCINKKEFGLEMIDDYYKKMVTRLYTLRKFPYHI